MGLTKAEPLNSEIHVPNHMARVALHSSEAPKPEVVEAGTVEGCMPVELFALCL